MTVSRRSSRAAYSCLSFCCVAGVGLLAPTAHAADPDLSTAPAAAPAPNAAPGAADDSGAADAFARKVFDAGRAAYEIGNYPDALRYFQQAYEMSGRSQLLYNIGQAADRLRMDETALNALKKYIEQVPQATNRMEVSERIKVLQDVVDAKRQRQQENSAAEADHAAAAKPVPALALSANAPVHDAGQPSLLSRWWFWAGAGAVVATAAVITIVAVSGADTTRTRQSFAGTNGKVVATLLRGAP